MLECEECRGGRRDSAKMSHPTALREGQPVAEKGLLTVEGTNVVAVPAGEATSGLTAGERQLWRGGQGASNLSSTPDSRDVLSSLGDGSLTTPGANAQLSAQVRPARQQPAGRPCRFQAPPCNHNLSTSNNCNVYLDRPLSC